MQTTVRSNRRVTVVLIVVVFGAAAIGLAVFAQRFLSQQAAVDAIVLPQEAFAAEVEKLGGKVEYGRPVEMGMFTVRYITGVTLPKATPTSDFYSQLSTLTELRRLNLDGTNADDAAVGNLGSLKKLETLSLADTPISNLSLTTIGNLTQLKSLTLSGTAVDDASAAALAGLGSLTSLDISQTNLTAASISQIAQIKSLRTIALDDDCISEQSIEGLKSIPNLEVVEVRIAQGLGKSTRDLLSGRLNSLVEGVNPSGVRMWKANLPWEEAIAGVAEILSNEVQLDKDEQLRLLDALRDHDFSDKETRNMGQEATGEEITSVGQLIDHLKRETQLTVQMRQYVREKITTHDIPPMLEAVRGTTGDPAQFKLRAVGIVVLAQHGFEQPEVRAFFEELIHDEKDRMEFFHELNPWRSQLSGGERWPVSESFADFAMPHFLKAAASNSEPDANDLWSIMVAFALDHPKYVRDVVPYFPKWLSAGKINSGAYSIEKLVELDPDACLSILPELRRMLADPSSPRLAGFGPEAPASFHENIYRQNLEHAIASIVPYSPESPTLAAKHLAELKNEKGSAPEAWRNDLSTLNSLARSNNPETTRLLARGLLELSTVDNGRLAEECRRSLSNLATTIRNRKSRPDVAAGVHAATD